MKITIFGLAITSSWGNGHATTFRSLCSALHARGHRIVFLEHNSEWYVNNRDMPGPPFCDVQFYDDWAEVLPQARRHLADSDVAIVGSYFPDGIAAINEMLDSRAAVKTFYDIDTPITLAALRDAGQTDYLLSEQIQHFDIYFSFTGGTSLRELESNFRAKYAVPLYCSVDPAKYKTLPPDPRFACDLSYMGTYAPDRQSKIEELLCEPAKLLPDRKFIVAGPQYPERIKWPANVERIMHLEPKYHPLLYSSSRLTLNVTRRDMVMAGYSPSVRLFEAAACGATIASDVWPGLESFFEAGREILLPTTSADMVRYASEYADRELRQIGLNAQARVLSEHSNSQRAQEFERHVAHALQKSAPPQVMA
jgi:spore maturation protein CgeB